MTKQRETVIAELMHNAEKWWFMLSLNLGYSSKDEYRKDLETFTYPMLCAQLNCDRECIRILR